MKRLGLAPVALLLLLTLAGCSLHNENKATPTPAPAATQAASTAVSAAATFTGLDAASSQTITDGICTALIPDDWAESGNGRGTSPSGARFTLFGNTLSGAAAWTAAANIVATVAAGKGAAANQTADSISYSNGAGTNFEIRRLVNDRYCDFSVTSLTKVPDNEQAIWLAIGASMAAAPAAP